ncbi:MAG: hypothetical protein V4556_00010 [Bacteroidota bacterium]
MKLIALIFLLSFVKVNGQQINDSSIGFKYFSIGDSINKYENQLEISSKSKIGNILKFLPAETKMVSTGQVKFNHASITFDSVKKVNAIIFSKAYLKTDPGNGKKKAESEYNSLIDFLSEELSTKADVYLPGTDSGKYQISKSMIWTIGERKYYLTKILVRNNKKHKNNIGLLILSVY